MTKILYTEEWRQNQIANLKRALHNAGARKSDAMRDIAQRIEHFEGLQTWPIQTQNESSDD